MPAVTDPLLLCTTRVETFAGSFGLTAASGFFFERDERLFLVTSRHVLVDEPSGHHPDRIEICVHTDEVDLTRCGRISLELYRDGMSTWRQGSDSGGDIDVAVVEIDPAMLPEGVVLRSFTLDSLLDLDEEIALGTPVLLVGFPLGFFDTRHHLPVARHAAVASAFGVRFQGEGYFLTDARMHRGASGAPVVLRDARKDVPLPWRLLGIHSARLDMGTREPGADESLGLNCAWYADILRTLTR